jgi:hypothetical protein
MEPLEDVEDEDKGKDYDGEGAKDMVTNGSTKASE